jgi:hypothetical protein
MKAETKTKQGLNAKMLMFQKNIGVIKKDGKNPHFKSTYATLPQILSEVKPILTELGLVLLQPIEGSTAKTIIIDSETGEEIVASMELPTNLNAQQMGSCITYYRRYLLAGLLSLEIEDDDANMASVKVNTKPKFTEASFEAAKKANATIEQIKSKYELSSEMEAKYINYAKG